MKKDMCACVSEKLPFLQVPAVSSKVLPVILSGVFLFGFAYAVPIPWQEEVNNTIYDFDDKWNPETPIHNVPLLRNVSFHPAPASYMYIEEINVVELNSTEKEISRQPKQLNFDDLIKSSITCGVCQLGVGILHGEIKKGSTFEQMKETFVSLCTAYRIQPGPVCVGFFDVYGPELLPAYAASKLDPEQACRLIFGEACDTNTNDIIEWDLTIPQNVVRESRKLEMSQREKSVLKVLQLSDVHLDPDYEEDTIANCEEPLCCRSYSTPSLTESPSLAGRWGAYPKCDSPKILIENMLEHISLQHPDVDYILWTGDLPPHDIWNQTKKGNTDIIKETHRQMRQYFPSTPIFPAIGNHESVPAGTFAPPWMTNEKHSIDWLYKVLAEEWKTWLPMNQEDIILHGGFYSVLLKPKLRLISLNTNYCHNLNWWLMVNRTDPAKQLKWLLHELENAEMKDEKVHLIGHIAPGSADCYKTWSSHFYSIVDRYKDTIVAQVYGHTHADEFEVFYDSKTLSTPINIAYIGPSVTTYENFNPAYRIYYIDGDYEGSTGRILDHETWTTDLDRANEADNIPLWYRLYLAKDEYKMESLQPAEWHKLIRNMQSDDELFERFYRNYYRDSPTRPTCDYKCKMQILCDLKSGKSHSRKVLCKEFL